jgi:hypothetical protein
MQKYMSPLFKNSNNNINKNMYLELSIYLLYMIPEKKCNIASKIYFMEKEYLPSLQINIHKDFLHLSVNKCLNEIKIS